MIEAVPDIDETTDDATGTRGVPRGSVPGTTSGTEQPATSGAQTAAHQHLEHTQLPDHPGLSERDAAVLDFEKQWWKYAGAKEQAVRELFGLSATQYYQVLNTLIDSPAALAAEPMLVKRLRRMRTSRQRERTQRRSQV